MTTTTFNQLAPFIQEYIWRHNWTEIRAIQAAACDAILNSDDHLLIASGTASGKTEAAFLPILTSLHNDPPESIGVLYIAPLKALINDQFQRLDGLLAAADIPVTAWHGDISDSRKKRALRQARGVVQITPESLEGLLLRRSGEVAQAFSELRFVVIDEVHAFMADERGRQVLCLLERLARLTRVPPRRVGLSATLGDLSQAQAWLQGTTHRSVRLINDTGTRRQLHLALDHFRQQESGASSREEQDSPYPALYEHLFARTENRKTLIFRNSRQGVEETVVALRTLAEHRNAPDIYHVHHGSVSAAFRESAEHAMREEGRAGCTVATVTLELGIDLGHLERVVQVDAPPSVSSFVQRLGRTGRRGGAGEMLFYTLEPHRAPTDLLHRHLPWSLLQTIATIQLYLEDRWVEPARQPRLPFSLLIHQTLATLAQYGEQSPAQLAQRVMTLSPFAHVSSDHYRTLLRHLLNTGHVERTDEGGLIVGLTAERLVNDWHFLAVFPDQPEWAVISGTSQIGMLTRPPAPGQMISLVGMSWSVSDVDLKRKQVFVKRERVQTRTSWNGSGVERHDRVSAKMEEVLASTNDYAYLQPTARARLTEARALAQKAGLLSGLLHETGPGECLLTPWVGTQTQQTIRAILSLLLSRIPNAGPVEEDTAFALSVGLSAENLRTMLTSLPSEDEIREGLIRSARATDEIISGNKFDPLVPHELLAEAQVVDSLNIPAAMDVLTRIAR